MLSTHPNPHLTCNGQPRKHVESTPLACVFTHLYTPRRPDSPFVYGGFFKMTEMFLYIALAAGVASLLLATYYTRSVLAAPQGSARMVELSTAIRDGAMAFIRREYRWVSVFAVLMGVLIAVFLDWGMPWGAPAYVFGAVLSASAGYVGM